MCVCVCVCVCVCARARARARVCKLFLIKKFDIFQFFGLYNKL